MSDLDRIEEHLREQDRKLNEIERRLAALEADDLADDALVAEQHDRWRRWQPWAMMMLVLAMDIFTVVLALSRHA